MNKDKLIGFIKENGWKLSKNGVKYDFYSPPSKLGFQKGYELPIPIQENLEDHIKTLEETVNLISSLYDVRKEQFYQETTGYFETLLNDAIFFKLNSENVKFEKTLEVNEIWNFLKNLSTSYTNYVKINFAKKFSKNYNFDVKKTNSALSKFLNLSRLRVVALEYRSFSFGVSVDKIMGKYEITDKQIKKWRNKIINQYNDEVIDIDYNSDAIQNTLLKKYERDEIKQIYYPIIKSINNVTNYSISITNRNFTPKKKFKRLTKQTISSLLPKVAKYELEEKTEINFIKTIIPVDRSKNIIKLDVSELESENLFTQKLSEINGTLGHTNLDVNDKVELLKLVKFKLSYNAVNLDYTLIIPEGNITISLKHFNHIQKEFDEEISKLIIKYSNKENIKSKKDTKLYNFLTTIIPKHKLKWT